MNVIKRVPVVYIECYHTYNPDTYEFETPVKPYKTFSPSSTNLSGKGLTSYSWEHSVGGNPGTFSFTVKETNPNKPENSNPFYNTDTEFFADAARPLDIVKIYEGSKSKTYKGKDNNLVFIGVISTISFTANIQGLQRQVTVSGQSCESLFTMFTTTLDVVAQNFSSREKDITASNDDLLTKLASVKNIKEIIKESFKHFVEISNVLSDISAITIKKIIDWLYSQGMPIDFDKVLDVPDKFEMKYPVSSNFISSNSVNFFQWMENLFPKNVYEFFGYIDAEGNPRIKMREMPFDKEEFGKLLEKKNEIMPILLTNYTFTRTNKDVYTVFFPYVKGSQLSPQQYQIIQGSTKGYQSIKPSEMAKIYGYKVLNTTFVGYKKKWKKEGGIETVDQDAEDQFIENMNTLSTKMKEWYEPLEKMYTGTIEITDPFISDGWRKEREMDPYSSGRRFIVAPKIGEVITIGKYSFYINGEKRQWNYAGNAKIIYEVERGGQYSEDGTFSEMKGFSKYLAEVTNDY